MLLGCIADDFTGASDLANTLAKGGMRTVQFIGAPSPNESGDCDAGVVALKTRSIEAAEAVKQSLAALDRLLAMGCRQIVFKVCSTFDSTPKGNIGPVAEALAAKLTAGATPVCPAFPDAGRTVYMGHLFVRDRLLSESGMERHPLNPMTDPDIRRWLALQSEAPVGHLHLATIRAGAETVRAALQAAESAGFRLVVCDAIEDADLRTLGEASADRALLVGGSGIALGLPANFAQDGLLRRYASRFSGVEAPGCVLAGSCSQATLAQIDAYRAEHPSFAIDVADVIGSASYKDEAMAFAISELAGEPLIYSSAGSRDVAAWQQRYGVERVALALEAFFGSLAGGLVEEGVRRLVVAGGETSGAVVTALGLKRLAIGPEIDPGVPALKVEGDDPLLLALKSGNFGAVNLFEKALRMLREAS